ncbi:hypothetical protein [uncultured Sutterella sp.]|uniref:hypothetical protein n=1 Tax=uncultured Sutterella sp. TaxID=286133 RepID=UPI00261ABDA7|nr:hypothetical protein [uncultured Sutterella sp.]
MKIDTQFESLAGILSKIEPRGIESSLILSYNFDGRLAAQFARKGTLEVEGGEEEEAFCFRTGIPGVLFFDPSSPSASTQLPAGFELNFWDPKGFACHHAKAYAFNLKDGSSVLALGSFNFTEAGLYRNRELLVKLELSKENPAVRSVFEDWKTFLLENYERRYPGSFGLKSYVADLNKVLTGLPPKDENPACSLKLISSGYADEQGEGKGLHALLRAAKEFGFEADAFETLIVVTPFFDKPSSSQSQKIFPEVRGAFRGLKTCHFFSSIETGNWNASVFDCEQKEISFFRYKIPEKIEEEEARLLAARWRETDEKKLGGAERPLHAKVLMLLTKTGEGLLYIGSANFTAKAWLGRNKELGLLGRVVFPNSMSAPEECRAWVGSLLGVQPGIGDSSPMKRDGAMPEDPSEEIEDASCLFPQGLKNVWLEHDAETNCADDLCGHFVYSYEADSSDQKGEFDWQGLDVSPISRDEGRSVWVSKTLSGLDLRSRLAASRSLQWSASEPEDGAKVLVPFNVAAGLCASAELICAVMPENWFAYLADQAAGGQTRYPQKQEAEAALRFESSEEICGKTDVGDGSSDARERRDENAEIQMQSWIKSLGRFEVALAGNDGNYEAAAGRSDLAHAFTLAASLWTKRTESVDEKLFYAGECLMLAARVEKELSGSFPDAAQPWRDAVKELHGIFDAALPVFPKKEDSQKSTLQVIVEAYERLVEAVAAETTQSGLTNSDGSKNHGR